MLLLEELWLLLSFKYQFLTSIERVCVVYCVECCEKDGELALCQHSLPMSIWAEKYI